MPTRGPKQIILKIKKTHSHKVNSTIAINIIPAEYDQLHSTYGMLRFDNHNPRFYATWLWRSHQSLDNDKNDILNRDKEFVHLPFSFQKGKSDERCAGFWQSGEPGLQSMPAWWWERLGRIGFPSVVTMISSFAVGIFYRWSHHHHHHRVLLQLV